MYCDFQFTTCKAVACLLLMLRELSELDKMSFQFGACEDLAPVWGLMVECIQYNKLYLFTTPEIFTLMVNLFEMCSFFLSDKGLRTEG